MLDKIKETKDYLAPALEGETPVAAIILGTGLGALAAEIIVRCVIPYASIPHFPVPTVEGHAGCWITGTLDGRDIIAMQGRFHFYEGYSMQEVTFPVRVMQALGARVLIVSNAAGGVNPLFRAGDLMIITDHVNLFPEHPLRGQLPGITGARFPSMINAYSPRLIALAEQASRRSGTPTRGGVYAGMQGPSFETPAECRWLRAAGVDAVGMSTVPEVIVARHAGMECFGISVITNNLLHDDASHEEVRQVGQRACSRVTSIVRELLHEL